jgi:hypothetical protein
MTDADLPRDVAEGAARLTRLARRSDEGETTAAARETRDDRLAERGYEARVREDDDTLVCYPSEWTDEDGVVDPATVEDTGRAVEVPLSGAGDPGEFDEVAAHNEAVAAAVREEYGAVHGENAGAFATFMSNHYARRVETAGEPELRAFQDYFPRNAWPTDEQRRALDRSLELVFAVADGL